MPGSYKTGVADIAWCFHGYWAGMTPLADVVALPFMLSRVQSKQPVYYGNSMKNSRAS